MILYVIASLGITYFMTGCAQESSVDENPNPICNDNTAEKNCEYEETYDVQFGNDISNEFLDNNVILDMIQTINELNENDNIKSIKITGHASWSAVDFMESYSSLRYNNVLSEARMNTVLQVINEECGIDGNFIESSFSSSIEHIQQFHNKLELEDNIEEGVLDLIKKYIAAKKQLQHWADAGITKEEIDKIKNLWKNAKHEDIHRKVVVNITYCA
jgi:hypothetical protein